MQEIWKDIKFTDTDGKEYDYTGLYQVSNMGRVKSVKSGRIRKLSQGKTGYLFIGLHKNKQNKQFYVHRLVALMFLPNPNNLPQVNHKDENKENNYMENLEWCTCEYNLNYGTHNERVSKTKQENPRIYTEQERENASKRMSGEKNPMYGKQRTHSEQTKEKISTTLTGRKFTEQHKNNMSKAQMKKVICIETEQVFDSVNDAQKAINVNWGITACCKGKQKTCGDFHWMYYSDYLKLNENTDSKQC